MSPTKNPNLMGLIAPLWESSIVFAKNGLIIHESNSNTPPFKQNLIHSAIICACLIYNTPFLVARSAIEQLAWQTFKTHAKKSGSKQHPLETGGKTGLCGKYSRSLASYNKWFLITELVNIINLRLAVSHNRSK